MSGSTEVLSVQDVPRGNVGSPGLAAGNPCVSDQSSEEEPVAQVTDRSSRKAPPAQSRAATTRTSGKPTSDERDESCDIRSTATPVKRVVNSGGVSMILDLDESTSSKNVGSEKRKTTSTGSGGKGGAVGKGKPKAATVSTAEGSSRAASKQKAPTATAANVQQPTTTTATATTRKQPGIARRKKTAATGQQPPPTVTAALPRAYASSLGIVDSGTPDGVPSSDAKDPFSSAERQLQLHQQQQQSGGQRVHLNVDFSSPTSDSPVGTGGQQQQPKRSPSVGPVPPVVSPTPPPPTDHPRFSAKDYQRYPLFAMTPFGQTIKKVVEIIAPLVQEATLRFSPEGMSISGVEQVRMAVLSANFECTLFSPWKCDQVYELGVDTPTLSKILQHVTKYDALLFFIPNKNNPQIIGILMVKWSANIFNVMYLKGNEIYKNKGFRMPRKQFDGFMELPAATFQQHIHELLQTAQLVTFATDMKSFHMKAHGINAGQFAPRHITIYPSEAGVRFIDKKTLRQSEGQTLQQQQPSSLANNDGHASLPKDIVLQQHHGEKQQPASLPACKTDSAFLDEDDEAMDGEPTGRAAGVSTTVSGGPGAMDGVATPSLASAATSTTNSPFEDETDDEECVEPVRKLSNNRAVGGEDATGEVQGDGAEPMDEDEGGEKEKQSSATETPNTPSSRTHLPNVCDILSDMDKPLNDGFTTATYMLKYVYVITKATQIARKVIILFEKNGPLIAQFPIPGGVITYCLAVLNPDQAHA